MGELWRMGLVTWNAMITKWQPQTPPLNQPTLCQGNTAQDTSWLQHWSICPLSEVYTNQNLPYGMHIPTNTHLLSLWFMSIVLTKWVMEKYIIPPVITAAIIDKFQYYNKWVATDLECVCQNNNITHEQKCFLAWLQSWLGLACLQ